MKNIPVLSLALFLLFLFCASKVQASSPVAGTAAILVDNEPKPDARIEKLTAYLKSRNSPVADSAFVFIREADRASIDWHLVASIAGLESSFCRRIPQESYNCWGWGIPTGSQDGIHFTSYADGIAKVSDGLRSRYYNRGLITLEQIGRVYAASPTWTVRVKHIMQEIENADITTDTRQIAITL